MPFLFYYLVLDFVTQRWQPASNAAMCWIIVVIRRDAVFIEMPCFLHFKVVEIANSVKIAPLVSQVC